MTKAENTLIAVSYPSLRRRFLNYTVDLFILICTAIFIGVMIDLVGDAPAWLRGTLLIFMVFLYDPVFVASFGGTLGHRLLGMCVIYVNTGKNLNVGLAFVRFVVKVFFDWLSFLTITFQAERKAIHDIAVVRW